MNILAVLGEPSMDYESPDFVPSIFSYDRKEDKVAEQSFER